MRNGGKQVVRLILSRQDNIQDQIEIQIDVFDTVTAKKWIHLLKQAISDKLVIKKHVSHHGWIMDQSRTLRPVSYTHLTLPTILRV